MIFHVHSFLLIFHRVSVKKKPLNTENHNKAYPFLAFCRWDMGIKLQPPTWLTRFWSRTLVCLIWACMKLTPRMRAFTYNSADMQLIWVAIFIPELLYLYRNGLLLVVLFICRSNFLMRDLIFIWKLTNTCDETFGTMKQPQPCGKMQVYQEKKIKNRMAPVIKNWWKIELLVISKSNKWLCLYNF